jgi:hypothetical protein
VFAGGSRRLPGMRLGRSVVLVVGVWMEEAGRVAVQQLVRRKLNHRHQVVMMMHLMHLVQRRGVQLILPERNSLSIRSSARCFSRESGPMVASAGRYESTLI